MKYSGSKNRTQQTSGGRLGSPEMALKEFILNHNLPWHHYSGQQRYTFIPFVELLRSEIR